MKIFFSSPLLASLIATLVHWENEIITNAGHMRNKIIFSKHSKLQSQNYVSAFECIYLLSVIPEILRHQK